MKVNVYYFSGSGCTKWVADKAAQDLKKKGHEVVLLHSLENPLPQPVPSSELDLFISPIYFFGLPANVVKALKSLPVTGEKMAIMWVTSGGFSGTGRRHGAALLGDRGYVVIDTQEIVMPDTFIPLKASQIEEEKRKEVLQRALRKIAFGVDSLSSPPILKMESGFVYALACLVYFPYLWLFRHALGFSFLSKDNCINCEQCAKDCPCHVIQMQNGRPHWKRNCIGCLRCANNCPVAAIDMSKYAWVFGLVGMIVGWFLAHALFNILGVWLTFMIKVIFAGFGFVGGTFLYQKYYLKLPRDKGLVFKNKNRFHLSDEEKRL